MQRWGSAGLAGMALAHVAILLSLEFSVKVVRHIKSDLGCGKVKVRFLQGNRGARSGQGCFDFAGGSLRFPSASLSMTGSLLVRGSCLRPSLFVAEITIIRSFFRSFGAHCLSAWLSHCCILAPASRLRVRLRLRETFIGQNPHPNVAKCATLGWGTHFGFCG